jgi:hypothetical protein
MAEDRIIATDICWEVGADAPARTPIVTRRSLAVVAEVAYQFRKRPPTVAELELTPAANAVADSTTPEKRAIK